VVSSAISFIILIHHKDINALMMYTMQGAIGATGRSWGFGVIIDLYLLSTCEIHEMYYIIYYNPKLNVYPQIAALIRLVYTSFT